METATVTDAEGESYSIYRYDGRLFPNFSDGDMKSHMNAFRNLHVRDDDVFIASYPKADTLTVMYSYKQDLLTHVKKIAEFLGVDKNDELFEKNAERCDFQNMKDSSSFGNPWKSLTKDGKSPICRKGFVGDWKNWFTVAQNEMFDEIYNRTEK